MRAADTTFITGIDVNCWLIASFWPCACAVTTTVSPSMATETILKSFFISPPSVIVKEVVTVLYPTYVTRREYVPGGMLRTMYFPAMSDVAPIPVPTSRMLAPGRTSPVWLSLITPESVPAFCARAPAPEHDARSARAAITRSIRFAI